MAQQTAVEYLMDKLYDPSYDIKKQIKWFEQAKQMEKEQMSNFANEYADAVMGGCMKRAEQYYNETYSKQEIEKL